GPPAHRIDIRDRIGRGDAPEVIRIVHDRHEEIGGGDQRLLVVEPVNSGVVGGFDTDQQLGRHRQPCRVLENFRQHARRDLAAAAASVRKRSQARLGRLHAGSGASHDSRASANSRALNVSRSSSFSPTPMKYTGTGFSCAMAASTPPLAVPSSLVTTRPVSCSASSNALTCASAFWPVLPSITSSTSCGADASAFWTTRLIFLSSSIRCSWVGSRPAVSTSTTSLPRALPAVTASKVTAAGSPPSWLTISTMLRSAQIASCSRAAARKVSAAASSTDAFSPARCLVSLPIDVVLPDPFTPATMMIVGRCSPMTSVFSSGRNNCVSESARMFLTCTGRVAPLAWTRRLTSSSRYWVAFTPVSAISSALSSSSYRWSSICAPVKTREMLDPVLRSPALSFSSQRWRSGAIGAGTGISIACTRALPIRLPPCGAGGAGTGAAGGGVGFFLKKLNIAALFRITRFYETPQAQHLLEYFASVASLVCADWPCAVRATGRAIQTRQRPDGDRETGSPRSDGGTHAVGA